MAVRGLGGGEGEVGGEEGGGVVRWGVGGDEFWAGVEEEFFVGGEAFFAVRGDRGSVQFGLQVR